MKQTIALFLVLLLIASCSSKRKDNLVDIILVNGKGEIRIGEDTYRNTDSIRVEISELTAVSASVKHYEELDVTIFPYSTLTRDKDRVGKVYLTLVPENLVVEKKENQRFFELKDAVVTLPTYSSYAFESEEEYEENREIFDGFFGNPDLTNRFDSFKYLQVKKALSSFEVSDYLDPYLVLGNFDHPGVFGSPEDLSVQLVTENVRIMSVEGGDASIQIRGEWRLLNTYDEVLYRSPMRTYNSISGFIPESIHGRFRHGLFFGDGLAAAIEDAIRGSFYRFLQAERTQYFLDKRNPLYKETRESNQKLPPIQLKGTKNTNRKVSLEENLESTVLVTDSDKSSFGSGSVISEDGYILTNYHVVNDLETIFVTLNSGKRLKATLERCDKELDVALIKIDCNSCKPIGFSDTYRLGEAVFDIGTPLEIEHFNSVFSGIVAGIRKINNQQYIQTNSVSSNGMSGGPLVNVNGQQIGVRVWGIVDGEGDRIYGFCYYIPVSEAFKSLNIQR
ncbi:trypsin-like peptidase domain-containing protein [Fluviicola sp.]|uniref:S1C family serine protease n=1 Tax=Fluviicola sp. TaxID=1917219 RepID=UPI0031DAFFEF